MGELLAFVHRHARVGFVAAALMVASLLIALVMGSAFSA